MKKITLLFIVLLFNIALAQNKLTTNAGIIHFEASVPLFEEVKASNSSVHCELNTKTGEIFSLVLINDFHFKIALMEHHFNQYYLESDRYPKASFKGRISGFNLFIIGTNPKEFKMKGRLILHGKKKEINTLVYLRTTDKGLEISSDFDIKLADFKIEIPTPLRIKIAETVNVKSNFILN